MGPDGLLRRRAWLRGSLGAVVIATCGNVFAQVIPCSVAPGGMTERHSASGTIASFEPKTGVLRVTLAAGTSDFDVNGAQIWEGARSVTVDALSRTGARVVVRFEACDSGKCAVSVRIAPVSTRPASK